MKVTPAHDPNDFEAGLRHNLPQIDVMDEQAQDERECRPLCGAGSLRSAQAGGRRSARRRDFWSAMKDHTIALGKCDRCRTVVEPRLSEQWFVKIEPLAEAGD